MTAQTTTFPRQDRVPACSLCGAEGRRTLLTGAGETCETCYADREAQHVPATLGQRAILLSAVMPPWGIAGLLSVRESMPQGALDIRVFVAIFTMAAFGFGWAAVISTIGAGEVHRDEEHDIRDAGTLLAGATMFLGGLGMLAVSVGLAFALH